MSGRLWTDEEIGFLEDSSHLTAREAGAALGRSRESVQRKRGEMLRGELPATNPWTESDDDFIRSTPNLTSLEVAKHLGRSWEATRSRRHKLGVRSGSPNKSPHRVGKRKLLAKTCPKCGLLLDASWFRLTASRLWFSDCTRCRPRSGTARPERKDERPPFESVKRLQEMTQPTAVNRGNPWTDADHEVLADPDLMLIEKALRLGRTYYATHTAVSRSGYSSKVGRGDVTRGQWVIDNPNAPTPDQSAA